MNFDTIESPSISEARAKWKEYKQEEKLSGKIPGEEGRKYQSVYKELGKIYHAMKSGKVLIDIREVIKQGSVKDVGRPSFAIARANTRTVHCKYYEDGQVEYNAGWGDRMFINLIKALPIYGQGRSGWRLDMDAPVPMIPPKYRPAILTNDYYILWEVDEWSNIVSVDPYLLKRLTKYHFILLEGWDLTPLEVSVMKNYL